MPKAFTFRMPVPRLWHNLRRKQHQTKHKTAQMTDLLRRRLTALFACGTAFVLTAALCVTYSMACEQARAAEEALLTAMMTSLEDKLRYQTTVSDAWLTQQEVATHSIIYVEDNGVPLHFPGVWQTRTPRDTLIAQARALPACAAVAANLRGERAAATLSLTGAETYAVRAVCLARATQPQAYVTLFVLQDAAPLRRNQLALLARYAVLWLCGIATLWVVSNILVRRALRPAMAAWQQQTEFVAAAGHELRSPLAVIRASLTASCAETLPPQARGFIVTAEREATRMTHLTDDLLLLAAGDSGAWKMRPVWLCTDTVCVELYERFYALAKASSHMLSLRLPDTPLPDIEADAQYFPQMLGILVQNALDHTPRGTAVEIAVNTVLSGTEPHRGKHAKFQKQAVTFAVKDNGCGIITTNRENVFERFARGDKSRTGKAHFGLGLAVAQKIATLHGTRIQVENVSGGGAMFSVTLMTQNNVERKNATM